MKRIILAAVVTAIAGTGLTAARPPRQTGGATVPKMAPSHAAAEAGLSEEAQTALVKQYCSGCHSDRGKSGGLTLAHFDATHVAQNAEVVEKMIRKLRVGMMPPPAAKRPDADTVSAFVNVLEKKLD